MESTRTNLLHHPIYETINTVERIQVLMKHHAFAVWDFMSLLKRLQQSLTCIHVPWIPHSQPEYARFINEIVLGEETDEDGNGKYVSHFELYLQAMIEAEADTAPILSYVQAIREGDDPVDSLNNPLIPKTVREFVTNSLRLAMHGKLHEVAAAFFFGREDLIPDMFTALLHGMHKEGKSTDRLQYYLERHIELDGDHHGPLAERLLAFACQDDPDHIEEANQVAHHALALRIRLWDGVLKEIEEKGI